MRGTREPPGQGGRTAGRARLRAGTQRRGQGLWPAARSWFFLHLLESSFVTVQNRIPWSAGQIRPTTCFLASWELRRVYMPLKGFLRREEEWYFMSREMKSQCLQWKAGWTTAMPMSTYGYTAGLSSYDRACAATKPKRSVTRPL